MKYEMALLICILPPASLPALQQIGEFKLCGYSEKHSHIEPEFNQYSSEDNFYIYHVGDDRMALITKYLEVFGDEPLQRI